MLMFEMYVLYYDGVNSTETIAKPFGSMSPIFGKNLKAL